MLAELLASPFRDAIGAALEPVRRRIGSVLFTGMGGSDFASYPAFLRLAAAGYPAWHIETSELLGYAHGLVRPDQLLVVTSQSGSSAEALALLDELGPDRPHVMAIVNDTSSPLAQRADSVIDILAGPIDVEATGTASYGNSIVVLHAIADALLQQHEAAKFEAVPDVISGYLDRSREIVDEIAATRFQDKHLLVVGRGQSRATAREGALIIKEAAKHPAEGLGGGEFRHGPLDITDAALRVIVLAGDPVTVDLNRRVADDVLNFGGNVAWIGPEQGPGNPIPAPELHGVCRPFAEYLPLQLISIAIAEAKGIVPGSFRHIRQITAVL
ncbi:SIS domain-containing protein [Mycolicibacterium murale]|uniref:SIS domain-containing protein n=1 Tax=Mycolicibacterium murale TaxID=182220 RepID=UPI0018735EDE|nr:SIS domain-containing protein [Mycolicibacterium murale]MCV7183161.1 SIS domain-containing protein [Mycolicibacterium murale]